MMNLQKKRMKMILRDRHRPLLGDRVKQRLDLCRMNVTERHGQNHPQIFDRVERHHDRIQTIVKCHVSGGEYFQTVQPQDHDQTIMSVIDQLKSKLMHRS